MSNKIKLSIVAIIVGVIGLFAAIPAIHASGGSCTDKTAVVLCGTSSKAELLTAYDKNERSMQTIYSYMGISRSEISDSSFVKGFVYQNGDVYVNGEKVATGARTAGHNWGEGHDQVKIPNTSDAYSYKTSALVRDERSVLVSMVDGKYQFAFMTECGNPITGKPVEPEVPEPKPEAAYKCNALTASATKIDVGDSVTFTTDATASGGATIKNYVYTFGDGKTATGGETITHTYEKTGSFTAKVSVKVMVDGKEVTAPGDCVVTVVVEPEMCPIPGKEQYPVDDERCKEDKPAISISKKVNGTEHASVAVGDTFTYEIVVTNNGNTTLKDAVVTDTAPSQVTLVSSDQGTINGSVWTTTIDELEPGKSVTFKITARYDKYAEGTHTNNVCVDTPSIEGEDDACDDASTETVKPEQPIVELPETGILDGVASAVGLGGILISSYAYVNSRRRMLS